MNTVFGRWLDIKKLQAYLSISRTKIYTLINTGEFQEGVHFYKRAGKILFDSASVDLWVLEGGNHSDTIQKRENPLDVYVSRWKES